MAPLATPMDLDRNVSARFWWLSNMRFSWLINARFWEFVTLAKRQANHSRFARERLPFQGLLYRHFLGGLGHSLQQIPARHRTTQPRLWPPETNIINGLDSKESFIMTFRCSTGEQHNEMYQTAEVQLMKAGGRSERRKALPTGLARENVLLHGTTSTRFFKIWPCWPQRHFVRPRLFHLNIEMFVKQCFVNFGGSSKASFHSIWRDRFGPVLPTGIYIYTKFENICIFSKCLVYKFLIWYIFDRGFSCDFKPGVCNRQPAKPFSVALANTLTFPHRGWKS